MKKTGLLLLLCLTVAAAAQQADSTPADQAAPQNTEITTGTFPIERVQTPTKADLYCGGFVSKELLPNTKFVAGGLESPNTTKFATNDTIFLAARATRPASSTRSCANWWIPTSTNCLPDSMRC